MKILASRVDDVRRQREEWKSGYDTKKAAYEEKKSSFYKAQHDVLQPIQDEIEQHLAQFDLLTFDVSVKADWPSGIGVSIRCNDNNKFSDSVALSWNYDASYTGKYGEEGKTLKRETGSWSGLKAITPDQMDNLRQSIAALEYLNSIDWQKMLDKVLPSYQDFVGPDDNPGKDRTHEFDQMEQAAQVEDVVGDGKFYAGKSSCYKFVGATDNFFKVVSFPTYYCRNSRRGDYAIDEKTMQRAANWPVERTKKATIINDLVFPLQEVTTYTREEE